MLLGILSRTDGADKPQIPVSEGAEKVREHGRARHRCNGSQCEKGNAGQPRLLRLIGILALLGMGRWRDETAAVHGWLETP